jgi:hypothetical protein
MEVSVRAIPRFVHGVPLVPIAFVSLLACGGSSVGVTSTPDGGVTPGSDGSGVPDSSLVEASTPGEDAGGSADDASAPVDSGKDGGSCSELGTRKDCVACCDTVFAAGFAVFESDIQVCACQPDLCGAIDGGVPDGGGASDGGDAGGDLGVGACSASCGTTTVPSAACERCFLETLGTAAAPGDCRASVTSACASSAACKRYVACTDSCPAK